MIGDKIVLGTVQFGLNYGINSAGKPDAEAIKNILNTAYKNGINLLDSAEAYGSSLDEIAAFHQSSSIRFNIINKIGDQHKDVDIEAMLDQRLNQLDVDHFYALYFHSFSSLKNNPKLLEILNNLKQKKKICRIGVSFYTNEEAEFLLNNFDIDIVQMPFNLLDNFAQRGDVLKAFSRKNIEVHARSSFLQGLFFKDIDALEAKLQGLSSEVRKLQNICSTNSISMESLALNYVLQNNLIHKLVIGVDSEQQLLSNLNALNKGLPEKTITDVDRIFVKDTQLLYPYNW